MRNKLHSAPLATQMVVTAVMWLALSVLAVLPLARALPVQAATPLLVQGYTSSSSNMAVGMGVAFIEGSTTSIEPLTPSNTTRFAGIVSRYEPSAVVVGNNTSTVYVTREGSSEALVSDLNGRIAQGDRLTISPLSGVFTKATNKTGEWTFATVSAEPSAQTTQDVTIRSSEGSTKQSGVSLVPISIQVAQTPAAKQNEQPETALQRLGRTLTNKPVSQVQVISALVLFILMLVIEGVIIYAAVRSSIISVGRNPLAKASVYRQLRQILMLAVVVLIVCMLAIYGILWA